ncbi:drug/metabolite transporter (DMT)-like permease [Lewinella marina]|uniref:EamA family transporter n=1 Tax=Neolewinella marina TaxID=438751 RepID=A0A2G0CJX5_9BACT|nr:EamA family transporter [Neolewinella marina]NJB84544.1 drug/metabolite transporter (DMT)-like permease [Neolewinella marina]PHL00274.1 EamA family transporter [Neolewinella marina]
MGRDRLFILIAFLITYFVWGATYLANYWAIDSIPVFGMGASRFFVAGSLMYLYTLIRGDFSLPKLRYVANASLIGILLLGIGTGAVVWAQQYIPTSTTSLIIAFEPLVVMLMMWGWLSNRPPLKAFFGAFVSIIGMGLLITQPIAIGGGDAYLGMIGIASGMLCWGAGMLLRQRLDLGQNRVRATAMQMLSAGLFLFIFSLALDEWAGWSFDDLTARSAYSWLFLVVFGSIIAFSAFNYLLGKVSADKVSTNTYVNPVVAVLLGGLLNGEVVTGQSILAGAILLTGVYFINSSSPAPVKRPAS